MVCPFQRYLTRSPSRKAGASAVLGWSIEHASGPLLAQSGQFDRARVCLIADRVGFWPVTHPPPHQQAAHVTAPDQCCCNARKFLPRRRPHVTQSGHGCTFKRLRMYRIIRRHIDFRFLHRSQTRHSRRTTCVSRMSVCTAHAGRRNWDISLLHGMCELFPEF